MKNLIKLGFAALLSLHKALPAKTTAFFGKYPVTVSQSRLILPELFISYAVKILK